MLYRLGALPLFDEDGNFLFDEARLPVYRQPYINSLPEVFDSDPLPILTNQEMATLPAEYIAANYVASPVGMVMIDDPRVEATIAIAPDVLGPMPLAPIGGGVVFAPQLPATGSFLQTPFGVDSNAYARSLAPVMDIAGDVLSDENALMTENKRDVSQLLGLALLSLPFFLF